MVVGHRLRVLDVQVRVTVRHREEGFSIDTLGALVRTALSSTEGARAVRTHAVVLQPGNTRGVKISHNTTWRSLFI